MIKIELINCAVDPTSKKPEMSAALEMKERFEEDFAKYPNVSGKLYILHSVSIFGYKIRDIDLLLIGAFRNFDYRNKLTTKNYGEVKGLNIDSFICNIELKDMDSVTDKEGNPSLWKKGTAYIYKYKNSGEKNITEQAFDQKNEFRQYMKDVLNISPYMCDLIWFRALSRDQLSVIRGPEKDNALAAGFSFKDLLDKLLLEMNVTKDYDSYHLNGFYAKEETIPQLCNFLCENREAKGLTKKKFELLSQGFIDMDNLKKGVGDKLTIMSGRAGTGKTIQLLQLAFRLADSSNDKRCLILTYNNALVCDIRRLIDFTDIPIELDGRTVSIQTVDSFFIQLMVMFEIIEKGSLMPLSKDYNQKFDEALQKFYDTFVKDLENEGVSTLKDLVDSRIDWDYIMIDEGQDWPDLHKNVIFKLYGPQRIVAADGIDQFMMSTNRQQWTRGLDKNKYTQKKEMEVNLRQKTNLVEFINVFSSELNLGWKTKKNKDLNGGQIEVYSKYNNTIHEEIVEHCKRSMCENYDILILVPPSMVTINDDGESHFYKINEYKRAGIDVFDGTNFSNRHRYPTKDMARLYQYDSCRGLEGWVTVCCQLDELIKYKIDTTDRNVIKDMYQGFDVEQAVKKFVYLWTLMPLTRAVDRLIITLKDPNSEIGIILKNLSKSFDYIKWNIEEL